jgi:hypothetical protein
MGKNYIGRRKHEPRHIRLYQHLMGSDAWRDLPGNAIKVLLAIMSLDWGENNGSIYMSAQEAALRTGLSKNTAHKMLQLLDEVGFIKPTIKGHFSVKGGPATQWRLTWLNAPGFSRPTHDYRKWKGNKSRSQNSEEMIPKFDRALETRPDTVAKSSTGNLETPLKRDDRSCPETGTQTVGHLESASSNQHPDGNASAISDLGRIEEAELRLEIAAFVRMSKPGSQTRLAERSGIPGGTLSKFLRGRPLPHDYSSGLRKALKEMQRHAPRERR